MPARKRSLRKLQGKRRTIAWSAEPKGNATTDDRQLTTCGRLQASPGFILATTSQPTIVVAMTTVDRPKLVARLSQELLQKGYPRLQMSLIVLATGVAGFLASVSLLHLGLEKMWIRYPLAVAVSYGVFFLLLRVWISYQQRGASVAGDELNVGDIIDVVDVPLNLVSRPASSRIVSSQGSSSSFDWLSGLDGDEFAAVLAFLIALVVGAVACLFIVWSAPMLLAEVLVDAVVIAALRKKMVQVANQHWTWCALRRTGLRFLMVALVFSVAGGIIQTVRPGARSIGAVFHAESNER